MKRHSKVQFKKFCLPVKTSLPPAVNINESTAIQRCAAGKE